MLWLELWKCTGYARHPMSVYWNQDHLCRRVALCGDIGLLLPQLVAAMRWVNDFVFEPPVGLSNVA